MRFSGFDPCFDKNSKILILGSFPSVISRQNNFYYGNKQNKFWRVMAKACLNESIPQTIEEKIEFLFSNRLALWDIVVECEIEGSLDSNIKNYVIADLNVVLSKANVNLILLNGLKAAEIFKKNYSNLKIPSVVLPSTSPANTRFDESKWLNVFKIFN